ncbi:transposase, IS204/IS1001/IS1096/IS1165 family protein [Azoarcus sp. CIB]|uniref:ISL3 family transposase n=1 Tax=Aromatoleum sp. (strain CIB) TaxID=198107 RepID=UPI00067BD5EA|nr:ISL3 family transposase [Azoarcus sp. CIB]AKU11279.1 transposase, IS204/IS1001/IS1096/IS1165 family protein [Azoarcus sp. CIB]
MLPLDLPGIAVTNTESDGHLFAIHAGCEGRPTACVTCGSKNFIGHGQRAQEVMDLPHHGKLTCIHLLRKRYRCKDCSDTFFHPLDWLDDDHHATQRFVDRIASLALERSFSDLAREYGINEKTVRNIFYGRYRDTIDTARFESPAYLGIDEVNIAGSARGVITNLSENVAIEFLPKCTNDVMRAYFEKMPGRENVKAVAMDCTKRYKNMVHEFFPKAKVVADKFHITRMADLAVDGIRKGVRAGIESRRMQLRLKKDKFVLNTRASNLTDWQKDRLASWRADFPDIAIAYDLKEEFYRIYDAANRREAKMRFDTWCSRIPPTMWKHWQPILVTFDNWGNEIYAFFDVLEEACKRLTNAYTECQNGLTRAIDRIGRGYSFDAVRVKLLLAPKKQGMVTSYRSVRRKKNEPQGPALAEFMLAKSCDMDDGYETVKVPERRQVTWGVDIAKLADWLEEDLTGQL